MLGATVYVTLSARAWRHLRNRFVKKNAGARLSQNNMCPGVALASLRETFLSLLRFEHSRLGSAATSTRS